MYNYDQTIVTEYNPTSNKSSSLKAKKRNKHIKSLNDPHYHQDQSLLENIRNSQKSALAIKRNSESKDGISKGKNKAEKKGGK